MRSLLLADAYRPTLRPVARLVGRAWPSGHSLEPGECLRSTRSLLNLNRRGDVAANPAQVALPYWQRSKQAFPTVDAFAADAEQQVLLLW